MSRWRRRWHWARRCGKPVPQNEEIVRVSYAIKEIFLTLQGEGAHTGRAAVFCRFSGCNLWSGREQDRATATCQFCDTDFVGTDGTLRRPDRRRTAAAGRYGADRGAACARL